MYKVKTIFKTVQGEGCNAGRAAVFVRFVGCNAWNGDAASRERNHALRGAACALWCDTDFTPAGSTRMSAAEIAAAARNLSTAARPLVVLTGGEPMLQVDAALLDALGWAEVAIETNGSVAPKWSLGAAPPVSLVTISPKRGLALSAALLAWQRTESVPVELKVVLPGVALDDTDDAAGWQDEEIDALYRHLRHVVAAYVQPMDPVHGGSVGLTYLTGRPGHDRRLASHYAANVQRCLAFLERRAHWRLGGQLHKVLDLP